MGNAKSSKHRQYHNSTTTTTISGIAEKKSENLDELLRHPTTDHEVDRLQSQHFLFQHIFGRRFAAPIEGVLSRGGKVLDCGCGPGAWLLDMATYYTQAEFYGVDIAKVYPTEIKPSNVYFFHADLLQGLKFEDESFDFVRISCLAQGLSEENFRKVLVEGSRLLKKGGWIELIESRGTFEKELPYSQKLAQTFFTIMMSLGVNLNIVDKFPEILSSEPSLGNIHKDARTISLGPSGGFSGKLLLEIIDDYFAVTASSVMCQTLGLPSGGYEAWYKAFRHEVQVHEQAVTLCNFWAQKM